jgi:hypothetical protein
MRLALAILILTLVGCSPISTGAAFHDVNREIEGGSTEEIVGRIGAPDVKVSFKEFESSEFKRVVKNHGLVCTVTRKYVDRHPEYGDIDEAVMWMYHWNKPSLIVDTGGWPQVSGKSSTYYLVIKDMVMSYGYLSRD